MMLNYQEICWQSAGPCLKNSSADRSEQWAGEKTHTGSPQHHWRWPNHTQPAKSSETNQNLKRRRTGGYTVEYLAGKLLKVLYKFNCHSLFNCRIDINPPALSTASSYVNSLSLFSPLSLLRFDSMRSKIISPAKTPTKEDVKQADNAKIL